MAILFDMDGVLVDSMPFHFQAWQRAFASLGVEVSQEQIYRREGEKGEVTAREILAAQGISPGEEVVRTLLWRKEELFREIAAPRFFAGVIELLEELRNGQTFVGLVTGTSRQEAEKLLPAGFLDRFDVVVTGDGVRLGKPHPEPYLQAVEKLRIDPCHCVVIENSPNGVRSAKAAGLYCIALTTSLPQVHLSQADRVVDSLDEAREALGTFKSAHSS